VIKTAVDDEPASRRPAGGLCRAAGAAPRSSDGPSATGGTRGHGGSESEKPPEPEGSSGFSSGNVDGLGPVCEIRHSNERTRPAEQPLDPVVGLPARPALALLEPPVLRRRHASNQAACPTRSPCRSRSRRRGRRISPRGDDTRRLPSSPNDGWTNTAAEAGAPPSLAVERSK
jgi:hypothetical protein